ncbi:MAG: hypothetical protein ACTSUL_00495 [Promethearchaeota archaeon]
MERKIDTSKDFIAFYKKKGDYLVELSSNHFKNREYKKCLELLNQAYNMYKKGNWTEEAEKVKNRYFEVKTKYLT